MEVLRKAAAVPGKLVRIKARSLPTSRAATTAGLEPPTVIDVHFSTTWLFVTIRPSEVTKKPEPVLKSPPDAGRCGSGGGLVVGCAGSASASEAEPLANAGKNEFDISTAMRSPLGSNLASQANVKPEAKPRSRRYFV